MPESTAARAEKPRGDRQRTPPCNASPRLGPSPVKRLKVLWTVHPIEARRLEMANPTIVLVHGAFADASGFRGLYNELLGEDVKVIAPPNPLRGLSGGDGAYIGSVVDQIDGPVVLVGHSYGGSVITAAGTADNVVGLV